MIDTKITDTRPVMPAKSPFIKIIIIAILLLVIVGIVVKSKKDPVSVTNGTETRKTDAIPPDSLHH